jgi:hypothetical protein
MTVSQKAIIRTLLYFDIFGHPLDKMELYGLISIKPGWEVFEREIEVLLEKQLIGFESGYFYVANRASPVSGRIKRNELSQRYFRIATFISSLIYHHPYVRGVMISGSLSKSAITRKDDIDFFIIAQPGRVWFCRISLMLFKKIFLFNSKKYFCINYIIDSRSLEIPEKNIFTATEIAYLIPLRNHGLYKSFLDANSWIRSYFPNFIVRNNICRDKPEPFLKKMVEGMFNGKFGDKMDSYFMGIYKSRAKRKYPNIDPQNVDMNIRNEKNVAKFHPNGLQKIVLEKFGAKISEFETLKKVDLTN